MRGLFSPSQMCSCTVFESNGIWTLYFYDPNGNQIASTTATVEDGTGGESVSLAEGVVNGAVNRYNGYNQLVETRNEAGMLTYAYDPSGLRVSKTVNGTETEYVLDGDQVVLELVGGSVTAVYIRGINLICSVNDYAIAYYLYNGHGDVVQLCNSYGFVKKEYDYDAFGNEKTEPENLTAKYGDFNGDGYVDENDQEGIRDYILEVNTELPWDFSFIAGDVNNDGSINVADITAITNFIQGQSGFSADTNGDGYINDAETVEYDTINDTNPFRYCGEYYDAETGTYYLRARYYSPAMGRFLSEDTYEGKATDPLSLNQYTYCSNNPVKFSDPSGHWQKGDKNLPDWAQTLILKDTLKYYAARDNKDKDGMDAAQQHAEDIRDFAARKNTYNMMQFFGVSDPTEIDLPDNAMVFLENSQSVSALYTGASIVRGRTIVMDFDRYCEYYFQGTSYGLTGIPLGEIAVVGGYVYNLDSPDDYAGLFLGYEGTYPGQANGGAVSSNGVYAEILGGKSWLAGSTGFSITYYEQVQSDWVYGKANINWYTSTRPSIDPFNPNPSL